MLTRMAGVRQPTIYAPPTSLHKTASTSTTIALAWTNGVSQPVDIYRNGTIVHTTSAGATSYTDTGLSASTVYSYQIRHKNGAAYSPRSDYALLATSLPTPGAISNVVTVRDVALTWSNTTGLASIELWKNDGGYALLTTLSPATTTYTDAGLSDGTYDYKLRYTAGGDTGSYNTQTVATVAASVNVPTGLSATATAGTGTQIDLAWTLGTTGAQTEIYRGLTASPTTLIATTSAGDTTFADTGLSPNTLYYYRFKGLHDTIESTGYTSDVSATTHNPPSGPPTGLSVTGTLYTDRASLGWTNADSGASINIYRDGSLLTNVAATTTTHNDDTVVAGTSYVYTLKHLKDGIESTATSGATANVPNPALASQSVIGTIGDDFVTFAWTIAHGPHGATIDLAAWDDGDGDTGAAEANISTGHTTSLGFEIKGKNPGVTHDVYIGFQLKMRNAATTVVLTDSSFAFGGYKTNGG